MSYRRTLVRIALVLTAASVALISNWTGERLSVSQQQSVSKGPSCPDDVQAVIPSGTTSKVFTLSCNFTNNLSASRSVEIVDVIATNVSLSFGSSDVDSTIALGGVGNPRGDPIIAGFTFTGSLKDPKKAGAVYFKVRFVDPDGSNNFQYIQHLFTVTP